MGIITRLACDRAKQEGVEVDALLRKAGLTHPQKFDLRMVGLLYYVLASAEIS
jgi:hypothetical protein